MLKLLIISIAITAVGYLILRRVTRKGESRSTRKNGISVITLEGAIRFSSQSDTMFRVFEKMVSSVIASAPRACIVRINSPGGTVGASDAIYRMLLRLRSKGIHVVALMEDVAASGGVYAAMGAEHIIAHGGTVTGSVGVIMQSMNYRAVADRFGVRFETIKSGVHKDILSPTRDMTPEDRALLQEMIQDTYEQFCGTIAESRSMTIDRVHEFADGRVFTGRQALSLGLIDGIGGMDEAIAAAEDLAEIPAGASILIEHGTKAPLLRRLGIPGLARNDLSSRLLESLPEAELTGIPLLMMPR